MEQVYGNPSPIPVLNIHHSVPIMVHHFRVGSPTERRVLWNIVLQYKVKKKTLTLAYILFSKLGVVSNISCLDIHFLSLQALLERDTS